MLSDDEVQRVGSGRALVRDDAAPADAVARWHAALQALFLGDRLRSAGVGRAGLQEPQVRSDQIVWADEVGDGAFDDLQAWFVALGERLNDDLWLGLRGHALQLAAYREGAAYARHRDAFRVDPRRRLTAILYLNPGWTPDDGGLLRVFEPEGPREVAPVGGRLVVFLSERLEHEVLPARAVRFAATAWYAGPDAR